MIIDELRILVERFISIAGPIGIVLLFLIIVFKKQIKNAIKH